MKYSTATRETLPIEKYNYDGPLRVGYYPDSHWCPDSKRDSFRAIRAVAKYFKDQEVDIIVHAGDANDLASLSSYDVGKRAIEGRRLRRDLRFSKDCLALFNDTLGEYADVDRYMTEGNHCDRLTRLYNDQPHLHGALGDDPFGYSEAGWHNLPFLHMVEINGVVFSHYFQNPNSVMGSPIGGTIDNCIKNMGHSFVQGHVQTLKSGQIHRANGSIHCGLIAGACYLDDHGYKQPQGNSHFRGAVVLDNMEGGYFDVNTMGMRSLMRRYG